MRYIRTTNNQIEFIEANDEGKILSSIGLQLGEVYFQIKNKKVAFYLNDSEKPFDNFIWSMNIPITIDGETYEDEDEVSNVLHNIMNDRFQEQLDELRENLAAEEARAQEAEAQLDDKIDDESARAIAAENRLQDQVTELSGAVAVLDNRVTNVENDLSALTDTVNDEITRSTAKDAEHDAQISGLTNTLNSEIQRALSAETQLHNEITAEEARAFAAESAITSNLNAEINRATNKDTEHDAAISGLTNSLNSEIQRAQNAESALTDALNSEIQRALSAETSLHNEILAETNRAQAAESGLTNSINTEISRATSVENALRSDLTSETSARVSADTELQTSKADKVSAVASAIYNTANKTIDFKNISGTVISTVDARDFIKDGMVDTASISDNNLIITFNTDAGKEDIVIPLTDIFDPTNYYDKSAIDNIVSGINNSIETKADKTTVDALSGDVATISGNVNTLSGEVATISGDVITLSGDVQTLSGEVQTISGSAITSGEVQTQIDNSISGKQDTLTAGTNVQINNNVISATDTKYTAGRAIDITNNVVSFTLPISAGTGNNSVVENYIDNKATKTNSHAEGYQTEANGSASHAEGTNSKTSGNSAHAEGYETKAIGEFSHSEGRFTTAIGHASHAEGWGTDTSGNYEHAGGYCNRTYHYPNSSFGNSANTLFTVGNSEVKSVHYDHEKHNAFEVRENGDIYIADTSQITGTGSGETEGHNFYDVPMIKLQDALAAAGGSGVTSGQVQTMIDNSISGKADTSDVYTKAESDARYQQKLTAGSGISIQNNVISATGGSSTLDVAISGGTDDASHPLAIIYNHHSNVASGSAANAFGVGTKANGGESIAVGAYTEANGFASFAGGDSAKTNSTASESFAYGQEVETSNIGEAAFGSRNKSNREVNGITEVSSGCTLFSIGNPHSIQGRDNALEIRKDDSIYIVKTPNSGTREVVKLQDYLVDPASKQDTLSAGTNVQINNNVISATDTTYTAGDGISISNQNVISTTTKFWCGTQAQYDAISVKDPNTVYMIHN